MIFDRFISLIGNDNFNKISSLNILIIGIGGVGGYTLESLVRSGITNITIIDPDIIDITNLNRQIITNTKNIGNLKIKEAKKRMKSINPNIKLAIKEIFVDKTNIHKIINKKYDYIIDTCDTITTKELLIKECLKKNIKIISSMGTAKKLDASKLEITTLNKTNYDKLAKKLRKNFTTNEMKKVVVVSSTEQCEKGNILGSTSYLPAIAGLLITNYIINDTIKNKQ